MFVFVIQSTPARPFLFLSGFHLLKICCFHPSHPSKLLPVMPPRFAACFQRGNHPRRHPALPPNWLQRGGGCGGEGEEGNGCWRLPWKLGVFRTPTSSVVAWRGTGAWIFELYGHRQTSDTNWTLWTSTTHSNGKRGVEGSSRWMDVRRSHKGRLTDLHFYLGQRVWLSGFSNKERRKWI